MYEGQVDPTEPVDLDGDWWAEAHGLIPEQPNRVVFEPAPQLRERDPESLTDAEAITRLVEVETQVARCHAERAGLVELVARNRPASADRPEGRPGAAGWETRQARKTASGTAAPATGQSGAASQDPGPDVVPELLHVSEWLSHELQMAHPYSRTAVLDLVETSLVLTGRLSATLGLLAAGRIDYPRARIMADLLGTVSTEVAHTVEAMVLPKAPGLTPGGLATAVRRALTRVDAAAIRARHARARRIAGVGYYPTQDGMARLYADLPLPVAAACTDAIGRYADTQRAGGDTRPIGQIRTEVLTELILRPWDTTRPPVTAEITLHLTIPTTTGQGVSEAEVNGQPITAAQCRDLLAQLDAHSLYLALHDPTGTLHTVATPAQLRRATHRRTRRTTRRGRAAGTDSDLDGPGIPAHDSSLGRDLDGPGLRPPQATGRYRPTRAQDRHVRTRDRTCRHFGCTRRAVHCDLDHPHTWPEGETSICNLCCYCRSHHRLRHQAPGWTHHFGPDGTLTITTPTAITRVTRPPGPGRPEPDAPQPETSTTSPSPGQVDRVEPNDEPPPF